MRLADRFGPYVSIGIQIVSLALGLVCNFLLARSLGTEGYGEYSVVYNLITVIGVPLEVGLAMVMVREISRYRLAEDWGHLRGAVIASFIITAAFTVPCVVIILFGNLLEGTWFSAYTGALAWSVALLPIGSLVSLRGSILRGLGNPLWGQLLASVVRPGVFALLLIGAYLFARDSSTGRNMPASFAMALHVSAAMVALIIGLVAMKALWPKDMHTTRPLYQWRRWLLDIPGFSLMAAVFALNQAMGSFILAYYHQPSDVGLYRVAELGASLVSMPLSTLAIYFSADVSRLLNEKDFSGLRSTLRHGARTALICASPVVMVLTLFGGELISFLFGEMYSGAWIPLIILSLAQIVNTFTGLVGIVMNMGGHHREVLVAVLVAVVAQAMSAIILTPSWGATGAALASAVGTIFWSQLLRIRVKQRYRVSSLAF